MNFFSFIFQDWQANRHNTKGRIITLFFRIANYGTRNLFLRILFFPYRVFYKFFVEWILTIELPSRLQIGKGLRIYHGQALVVNEGVRMGQNVTVRHSTTMGNKIAGGGFPVIGSNVDIGSNVCILGDITIGDNVTIGAGSVVVKSVPNDVTVVGNPAKVINRFPM